MPEISNLQPQNIPTNIDISIYQLELKQTKVLKHQPSSKPRGISTKFCPCSPDKSDISKAEPTQNYQNVSKPMPEISNLQPQKIQTQK